MALTTKQKAYITKHKVNKSAKTIAADLKLNVAEVNEFILSQSEESKPDSAPQKKKQLIFTVIMLLIPVLFFASLEIGLRLGNYRGDLSLFVVPKSLDGKYVVPNPNFTSRYFFSTQSNPSPSDDVFLFDKPENSFRVFVMGGSTANGYPYGFNGSFSRVFRDALQDVMYDRHVEVVNVATSAINTYSLYDQIREILHYEPDAILVYSGHNEYYGALGVGSSETFGAFPGFVRLYLGLQRYKTFLLIRDGITRMASLFARPTEMQRTGTLMQRMVAQQQIPLDSDIYQLGKNQFESNLNAIMKRFGRKDIPVFIGSLTSNLKDHAPFLSVAYNDHPPAADVFNEALRAYSNEQYDEARQGFIRAKDLDALRFRAPESFNEIIYRTSNRHSNVTFVPVSEYFTDASTNGIVGFELMLEHLHPNLSGYHLMAQAYLETFVQTFMSGESGRLNPDWEYYRGRMQITELDERIGDHRIKLLMNSWPFRESRDPFGYPRNYRFTSEADSMAFLVVHESKRWDQAKVELATIYERTNRPHLALAEYHGLMRAQPFNDSPFLFAARIWLAQNNFVEARPLLEQALAIETSAFASRMLGAIEVDSGNIDIGIELLEQSLKIESRDAQALFNLSGAYGLKRDFSKADEVLRRLESIDPNFPGARQWRQQLDAHLRNSSR
ncbi:MAG: hypothetical protein LAT67_03355 [Balneolales bacterium]|nr:hypothetical protein [Balneolales bacterium]